MGQATYGQGFIEIEPTLARNFGAKIGSQLEKDMAPSLSKVGATMAATIGAAFSVRAIADFAKSSIAAFSDVQESTSKAQVVFGEFFGSVDEFAKGAADSVLLSSQAALEAAGTFGNLFTAMGISQKAAADLAPDVVELAADLASFNNLEVDETLEKLRAGLVGETEPLRALGVAINAAMVESKALELGLADVNGEISESAKVQARWQLILEATTNAQGDVARTSDGVANTQRRLAAEFDNLRARVGEALLPVYQDLLSTVSDSLPTFEKLATTAIPAVVDTLGNFVAGVGGVLDFFSNLPVQVQIGVAALGALTLAANFGQAALTALAAHPVLAAVGLVAATFVALGAKIREREGEVKAFIDVLSQLEGFDPTNIESSLEGVKEAVLESLADRGILRSITRFGGTVEATFKAITGSGEDFAEVVDEITGFDWSDASIAERMSGLRALSDADRELIDILSLERTAFQEANKELSERAELDRILAGSFPIEAFRVQRDELELMADVAPVTASALDTVRAAAGEAGLSMADLVAGTDPATASLLASLDPAGQLALKLEAVRTGAVTAAEAFSMTLQPALIDVALGLVDLNKNGKVSLDEFTANLQTAAQDFLDFQVNLAAIAQISPELAAALKALPDEVQAAFLAEGFANADEAAILAAAEGLTGSPEQISGAILDIYLAGLRSVDGRDPQAVQEWLGIIAGTVDIPGATAILGAGFQDALNASFADLEPPSLQDQLLDSIDKWNSVEIAIAVEDAINANLQDVEVDLSETGRSSGATFIHGMQEGLAAREDALKASIITTFQSAIDEHSPSKLFLGFGAGAAGAFWQGFGQTPFDFPRIDLAAASLKASQSAIQPSTEMAGTGATAAGLGGPVIGEVNFYDPREKPAEESLQEAGLRVAVMLNLRK